MSGGGAHGTLLSVSYVQFQTLNELFQNLTEVDDKACFCGELVKYSEMLTSVEALLCSSHLSQGDAKKKKTRQDNKRRNKEKPRHDGKAMYEPIAFHVTKANLGYLMKSDIMKFESIITNHGEGWNLNCPILSLPQPGQCFLAPKDGIYHFSWTVLSAWDHPTTVHLFKWGEKMAKSVARAGNFVVSGSAVLTLYKGDQVYLQITDGMAHEGADRDRDRIGDNSFSGYLIEEFYDYDMLPLS